MWRKEKIETTWRKWKSNLKSDVSWCECDSTQFYRERTTLENSEKADKRRNEKKKNENHRKFRRQLFGALQFQFQSSVGDVVDRLLTWGNDNDNVEIIKILVVAPLMPFFEFFILFAQSSLFPNAIFISLVRRFFFRLPSASAIAVIIWEFTLTLYQNGWKSLNIFSLKSHRVHFSSSQACMSVYKLCVCWARLVNVVPFRIFCSLFKSSPLKKCTWEYTWTE